MANDAVTFEQIDSAVKKLNLADYAAGGKHHLTAEAVKANPAVALPQLCPIYKSVVRPILVILSNLPIIPASWREVIKVFIGILDTLCP